MRPVASAITAITDALCEEKLDDEYRDLCCGLVDRLARKRPSPIARGRPEIWAAGVIYTVGSLNFLFDRSQQLNLTSDELADCLDVAKSTMANKAALIRKILGLRWFEPDLTRGEMLERHPMAWLVELDGLVVDARRLPAELQDEARKRGLIPDLDRQRAA